MQLYANIPYHLTIPKSHLSFLRLITAFGSQVDWQRIHRSLTDSHSGSIEYGKLNSMRIWQEKHPLARSRSTHVRSCWRPDQPRLCCGALCSLSFSEPSKYSELLHHHTMVLSEYERIKRENIARVSASPLVSCKSGLLTRRNNFTE